MALWVVRNSTYLKSSLKCIHHFYNLFKEYNIHVIVSKVDEGLFIYNELSKGGIKSEFIHSKSDNQENVATNWSAGAIRILISKTLGLVGNESAKTQLIVIVGVLYNLLSIVQAMGRIRPL